MAALFDVSLHPAPQTSTDSVRGACHHLESWLCVAAVYVACSSSTMDQQQVGFTWVSETCVGIVLLHTGLVSKLL